MHCLRREGRQTDRDILGPFGARRAVADPFPFIRDNRLTGCYVDESVGMLHPKYAPQHDREFIEIGGLSGLYPAGRTAHVRDAGKAGLRGDSADIFVNQFRLGAGGLNTGRLGSPAVTSVW